jgi:hypothetical protein
LPLALFRRPTLSFILGNGSMQLSKMIIVFY